MSDALNDVLRVTCTDHPGGYNGLAEVMGKSPQMLRNLCGDGEESRHKMGLREAISLMRLTNDLRLLHFLASSFGHRLVPMAMPQHDTNLLLAVVQSAVEHGDVVRVVNDAVADGHVSRREAAAGIKEIRDVRDSLDVLESLLTRITEQGGYL